jgi:UPF0271 protein
MGLQVQSPGLLCTLQDRGRFGFLDRGVPPSGALDPELLAIANALAGNEPNLAAVEMIGLGPRLEVSQTSVRIALAGDVGLHIDNQPMPSWRSYRLRPGQIVTLGAVRNSRAAYLAVAGGFDSPLAMGSRATYVRAGLGLRLTAGQNLPLTSAPFADLDLFLPEPKFPPPTRLRVIEGPQANAFPNQSRQLFYDTDWTVGDLSDRMGLRLQGPPLSHRQGADIPTEGLVMGCIQVPGDGLPILLLNDHQTTGGYAKIATVIGADLARAGRLMPGHKLRFAPVSWQNAKAALVQRNDELERLLSSIRPVKSIDETALLGANLVSGAVNALDGDDV